MSKRILLSLLLGTLILFIWYAISWMVLPFHSNSLQNIPESTFSPSSLQTALPKDGVYHYPGYPDPMTEEAWQALEEKVATGPRITMMVYKSGPTELFAPTTFLTNLLFNFLTVVVLLLLVNRLKQQSTNQIMSVVLLLGLLVGLVSDFPLMNWYLFPLSYTLINVMDHLVAFVLLGLLFSLYTYRAPRIQIED